MTLLSLSSSCKLPLMKLSIKIIIIPKKETKQDQEAGSEQRFDHYRNQLSQRVEFIKTGLHRMGITTRTMTTEELIMLFWNLYNPQNLQKRTILKSVFEKFQVD